MARDTGSVVLAKLARETAREVGCQALAWWQEEGEPGQVYITAKPLHLPHQALVVQLKAVVPPLPPAGATTGAGADKRAPCRPQRVFLPC
jgi:hypothetical protein